MGQIDYNQTQEYYGEYKQGFFGAAERIFICFSAQTVFGRGMVFNTVSGKFEAIDFKYQMDCVTDVENDKFNGKQCTVLRTNGSVGVIYLPGLAVMTSMVKNTFGRFKNLAAQMEAEKFKVEAFTVQKSSEKLSLEEEMAEFKEKVNRLKIMRENGVLSPVEYQELKSKLMNLYN